MNRYILDLKERGLSESTINTYIYILVEFNSIMQKWGDIRLYFDVLEYNSNARNTIALKAFVVQKYLKFVNSYDESFDNLFEFKKKKEIVKKGNVLNFYQKKKIIEKSKSKRLFFQLSLHYMLFGGLRVSEVFHVKQDNLFFDDNILVINILGKNSKSKRSRETIIVDSSAISFIKNNIYKKDDIFPTSIRTIQNTLKAMFNDVDFNGNTHSLRRTYATDLYNNGIPIVNISDFLGHKSLDTTMRYINYRYDDIKKIIRGD